MKKGGDIDILQNFFTSKYGWLLLLFLQGVYLTLDVIEIKTEKIQYGMAASLFMAILGVIILLYSVFEIFRHREKEYHGIFEGIFYISFAVVLYYYKNKRYEESTEKSEKIKEQNIALQALDNRLNELNYRLESMKR